MRPLLSFVTLLLVASKAFAFPPFEVRIHYTDSNGQSYFALAEVKKGPGGSFPLADGTEIAMNIYSLTFYGPDGIKRNALTTDSPIKDYERLENYREDHPNELIRVPRSTGGFSPGKMVRPYLRLSYLPHLKARLVTEIGVDTSFQDFSRGGTSQADPKLNEGKFETAEYAKKLPLRGWNPNGSPKLQGSDGSYDFPALDGVNLKEQRFLLDFGKHPFDKDKQLVYPVYVDRYEGDNAVIIAPHEMQKLERAKAGDKVKVTYWTVPKAFLRIAPETTKGNQLLQAARLQFIEDEGMLVQRGLPIETIVRANRHNAEALEIEAGDDLQGSMLNLHRQMSGRGHGGECDQSFDASA